MAGPDIVFLKSDNVPDVEEAMNFQGVPDLLVEVLSPGTRRIDLEVKLKAYEQAGVVLGGFELKVAELFAF
jgi:Uma2 family endonuclease